MEPIDIERLEQSVMSLVVQALTDYGQAAATIFSEETDSPQDIAEDVTREAIEAMGVSSIHERLYGKVDVKKAIYAFLPDPTPVALMLDAKAEKTNGNSTATIQMSQTSMRVRMIRDDEELDMPGGLEHTIRRNHRVYQVVTIIAKYAYQDLNPGRKLDRIIVACIPNGRLQARYNPTPDDSIWRAGRNAHNENFRVRLSYESLRNKAPWRVQDIPMGKT